jgi:hypothetical protein
MRAERAMAIRSRVRVGGTAAATAFIATGLPYVAGAHHSVAGFDGAHGTTIEGRIERVIGANPHTQLIVDAVSEDGTHTQWIIESESPHVLAELGWQEPALVAGVTVTIVGARAKDGSNSMRCTFVQPDGGAKLPCFPGAK